jgi:hypothetical protein
MGKEQTYIGLLSRTTIKLAKSLNGLISVQRPYPVRLNNSCSLFCSKVNLIPNRSYSYFSRDRLQGYRSYWPNDADSTNSPRFAHPSSLRSALQQFPKTMWHFAAIGFSYLAPESYAKIAVAIVMAVCRLSRPT